MGQAIYIQLDDNVIEIDADQLGAALLGMVPPGMLDPAEIPADDGMARGMRSVINGALRMAETMHGALSSIFGAKPPKRADLLSWSMRQFVPWAAGHASRFIWVINGKQTQEGGYTLWQDCTLSAKPAPPESDPARSDTPEAHEHRSIGES